MCDFVDEKICEQVIDRQGWKGVEEKGCECCAPLEKRFFLLVAI